ncbi:unnamed protein product [Cylicocyclus nassatus]|uniref:Uncharacterized protein n=1 Tax=Cylicocyclus nassatus TaxID=53992 RepID=A0AA36MBZ5_CYLNA|nr:unnamed protein product [Cylicocyclus nassatus]
MSCEGIHSQLLFILLACYWNVSYYTILVLVPGHDSNLTDSTTMASDVSYAKYTIVIPMIVHIFASICIVCCIIMNNMERFAKKLPSTVIVTTLIFVLFFNVLSVLLMFWHATPRAEELAQVKACAILSLVTAVLVFLTMTYFFVRPSRTALIIHDQYKEPKKMKISAPPPAQVQKSKDPTAETMISQEKPPFKPSSDENQYENLATVNKITSF